VEAAMACSVAWVSPASNSAITAALLAFFLLVRLTPPYQLAPDA